MDVSSYLVELYGRLPDLVQTAVDDLDEQQLVTPPGDGANTIAWLVWHLSRVQDHHIAEVAEQQQRYLTDGWHERFGRGADPQDHGYGHTAADVASVRGSAEDLAAYHDAVHERTMAYLGRIGSADLERVIDDSFDPPVTVGVRLASLISDCLQHAGQAAYVRGLVTD